jgi:HAD superfamily hydrolase (TIGR01509 family)
MLRCMVFDVDGTLYRQVPVRRGMALRLLSYALRDPASALKTTLFIRQYRHAQEQLRGVGSRSDQLSVACELSGTDCAWGKKCVEEWMEKKPLDLIAKAIYPGLMQFLAKAEQRGIKLAVVSDYPAKEKLRVLGIDTYFCCVVSSSDPRVRRFKPAPDGILAVLRELEIDPSQAIYIGDRPDVDAEAAKSAGTACAILGRNSSPPSGSWLGVSDYFRLGTLLGLN